MIKGLIFDFDGTIANTMPLHWRAWRRVMDKYGIELSEERFYALGGVPARDIVRLLADEQGVSVDHLEAAQFKGNVYLELLPEATLIEEVFSIAREHRGQLPMAVATGGSQRVVSRVMEHLGIAEFFDAVVCNEDVENQKPAPDIFLEAARRIGVEPARCRAYEDTVLGMRAIRAAGMEAVDVRPMRGLTAAE